MKVLSKYILDLIKESRLIFDLAINDCKARFASSGLGIVWAFLQPLLILLVFWFVFQVGFRQAPVSDVPFMVWFTPAYLIWNFFTEVLFQVTNSLVEYSYLIKKVNFKVNIIPPIKIVANSIIHVVFIGVICFITICYGCSITLYALQVFYYFACTCILLLGLGWLLSTLNVFMKDVYNVVVVLVQIGFWATPVFWSADNMDRTILMLLKLNPMYYICMGYRDAFIYKVWFWEHPVQTIYFWVLTIVLLIAGSNTFERLHMFFDDAL